VTFEVHSYVEQERTYALILITHAYTIFDMLHEFTNKIIEKQETISQLREQERDSDWTITFNISK
jgi:hypothetical protein